MSADLVLAIDQGTTSTRAIAYDESWSEVATASRRLATAHPRPGWAEQDPTAILDSVAAAVAEVLDAVGGASRVVAAGIDNQGETVVPWDRATGEPLGPAVVWHCRRSQPIVDRVEAAGHGPAIRGLTGLPLDPYFSASKIRWLLEECPEVAMAAKEGRLAVGTVDAWLTARLGDGPRTDASTASRTQLMNLASLEWDDQLLAWWGVARAALPPIGPSAGDLGRIGDRTWDGALPLTALLCDQQAALVGQGGLAAGSTKATFGTGVFVLANVGHDVPQPPDGLIVTVGWTDADGRPTYALDGGVFSAGALLNWLHEGFGLIDDPRELDRLAAEVDGSDGVRILPALGGVGAPWWAPHARLVIAGLTPAAGRAHVARAAIDAIAHRTADVVDAMAVAMPDRTGPLRVDGGLTASRLFVQRLADLVGRPIDIAAAPESTALGIGLMAAIGAGRLTPDQAASVAGTAETVTPALGEADRRRERTAWTAFARRAIDLESEEADGANSGPTDGPS